MRMKFIIELLENRTRNSPPRSVTYVEDELYKAYDEALIKEVKYFAAEHKEPNLMFRSHVISPESIRPVEEQPYCCRCCCHGCKA